MGNLRLGRLGHHAQAIQRTTCRPHHQGQVLVLGRDERNQAFQTKNQVTD